LINFILIQFRSSSEILFTHYVYSLELYYF